MLKYDEIESVHIELTTRCNARCPMCIRNYRGIDYNSGYPLTELNLEQFKKILEPEFLGKLSLGVNFNGNLGDFGLAKDGLEIVEYLVENNVAVQINTNGSMRTPEWWASLAMPGVTIGWAIDGLADTHHLYRQDTDWNKIMANARAFIAAGGQAVWRFIPFKHNLHQIDQCIELSRQLGFIRFDNIGQNRNNGPVFSRTGKFSHWLGDPQQEKIPDSEEMVTNHIAWYDRDMIKLDKDTESLNLVCIHLKKKEIYIAADGTVYPCCFLGFYPQSMMHPGNAQIKKMAMENNALEYGLRHALDWFDSIEESWAKSSVNDGRLHTCVETCAV